MSQLEGEQQSTYTIISELHVNEWDEQLQRAVSGWQVKARWTATGTIIPVFVPDASYTADTVDKMIRAAGNLSSKINALGG